MTGAELMNVSYNPDMFTTTQKKSKTLSKSLRSLDEFPVHEQFGRFRDSWFTYLNGSCVGPSEQ